MGAYEWPVTKFVRSDVTIPDLSPTYVPYSAIATNFVLNLLIPGYATGVASLAGPLHAPFPISAS